MLAQSGFRPILLERGRTVRERTADTFRFWRRRDFNPESNVQFGEGGAGTFSDGKLYTQIRDPRHLARKVLTEFVNAGAPPEILYVSKPHIGTFRLVKVVEAMRKTIESLGGEIRFQTRVRDIDIRGGKVRSIATDGGEKDSREPRGPGHRPQRPGTPSRCSRTAVWAMTAKPFSVGLRIEHPQALIDHARYGIWPATRSWARPTTSWSTTARMAGRFTASACARAARWWRRRRSPAASSRTA